MTYLKLGLVAFVYFALGVISVSTDQILALLLMSVVASGALIVVADILDGGDA